eukprot:scaffold7945_cov183-Alexandrium_tamarense.AAC.8
MRRSPNTLSVLCHLLTALPTSAFVPPSFPRQQISSTTSSSPASSRCAQDTSSFYSSSAVLLSSTKDNLEATAIETLPSFSAPQPLASSGDWSAYLDESKGLIYYFHRRTGESTWEPPQGIDFDIDMSPEKKMEMRSRLKGYLEQRLNDQASDLMDVIEVERKKGMEQMKGQTADDVKSMGPAKKSQRDIQGDIEKSGVIARTGNWEALIDEKRGMIYYYNTETKESSWNRPKDFRYFKLSAAKRIALQEQNKRYLEWRKNAAKVNVLGKGTIVVSESDQPKLVGKAKQTMISPTASDVLQSLKTTARDIDNRLDEVDESPVPIVEEGDWGAYLDQRSGLVYYFNKETKESSWDPPTDDLREGIFSNMMETQSPPAADSVKDANVVTKLDFVEMAKNKESKRLEEDLRFTDEAKVAEEKRLEEEQRLARQPIDYDAAAILAFEAAGSKGRFVAFKSKYITETSDMVATKHKERVAEDARLSEETRLAEVKRLEEEQRLARQPVDYDAAARLAYESSGQSGYFDTFKATYLSETSAMIATKHKECVAEDARLSEETRLAEMKRLEEEQRLERQPVDYDAAARLAFESSGESGDFDTFKATYLSETSAMIAMKHKECVAEDARLSEETRLAEMKRLEEEQRLARQPVDYDAAARLAFESSGESGDFDTFKATYLSETSAMIATKHKACVAEDARLSEETRLAEVKRLEEEQRLARQPVDYDAAARLQYEKTDNKDETFDTFKANYFIDTSSMVGTKQKERVADDARVAADAVRAIQAEEEVMQRESIETATTKPAPPLFFLEDANNDNIKVEDPVIDEKEEEPVSAASVESQLEIDISRDEPTVYARTDTMNDAPKAPTLPLDDPFAAGNDVESLISPLKINTLYDILRCEPSATRAELKKSYILLAKETHPDALLQNGIVNDEAAEQRFVEIAHAWKILGDSTSRRRYDRELKGKGLAKSAGNIFENWVMGAAKAMDEALTKAENELEVNGKD